MIKVGFVINFKDFGWLGGINYYYNLLIAIKNNPDKKIEPIVFTGFHSNEKILKRFSDFQIIKSHIFDPYHPVSLFRSIVFRLFQKDIIFKRLLKNNHIQVLSHSGTLGNKSEILTIGWIPDFQHKYFPNFFSDKVLSVRDREFEKICREANCIIFSSNCAREDAEKYFPRFSNKFNVLHFVVGYYDNLKLKDIESLKEKYKISKPFFIVPNQFWAHKNHLVILDALNLLKSKNMDFLIISTGNTYDFRNPEYFHLIQKKISEYNISEQFKILGVIPYDDVLQLMLHSKGVINPSLFEGWSTTVEEAKSMDIPIILSDIPVHREQNPARGFFFNPDDPNTLAAMITICLTNSYSESDKIDPGEYLYNNLPRQIAFAKNYEEIVMNIIKEFHYPKSASTNVTNKRKS